ncbi:hypothetical protein AEAC466_03645 [Asticcacaulis sp. AC466]|uniref:DUF1192 domain-containing protein n=1 Tax=Asticcacaulis sp. AC466 TaxID=1282362 RepID=UPI0003C3FED4|nr:DUF1192 domain-containing protein [Asticcacaulis sp. AC466]ESQ86303.1 hypothetical protein AEAC466_03645 [Asticcacaulis sp. AC466]
MAIMDENESLARLNAGPLTALVREDLDPYSVEDLEARIETLESEIARARSAMDRKINRRSAADALFSFKDH